MSKIVATLERVREACNDLLQNGETVSAANVIKLVGGSKQTVLKHLEIVRPELGGGNQGDDGAAGFLHDLVDPYLRKVWAAAQEQAALKYQLLLRNSTSLREGLLEDIAALRASEEELQDRLVAAEAKLAAQASDDERIQALMALVEEAAGTKGGAGEEGGDGLGAAMKVATAIRELGGSGSPKEIDAVLRNKHGFNRGQAQRARYHSMADDLVHMSLTAKGRARLAQSPVPTTVEQN